MNKVWVAKRDTMTLKALPQVTSQPLARTCSPHKEGAISQGFRSSFSGKSQPWGLFLLTQGPKCSSEDPPRRQVLSSAHGREASLCDVSGLKAHPGGNVLPFDFLKNYALHQFLLMEKEEGNKPLAGNCNKKRQGATGIYILVVSVCFAFYFFT